MVTVFKNGRVHTMNREMPTVTAVAIEDDKIVYVGSDEGVKAFEAGAKVVDLDGKMLIPGLVDAHCHVPMATFWLSGMVFDAEQSYDEVVGGIREFVNEHPEKELYFGLGYPEWMFDARGPRKEILDEICPDKPMYLASNGGHEGWCNSKTFEVLGIDKNFPDPLPGFSYFVRDKEGNPTGHIIETVAQQAVMTKLPWYDMDAVREVGLGIFEKFAAMGITSIVDTGTYDDFDELAMNTIADYEKNGELKQRICSCVMVEDPERLEVAIPLLEKRRALHDTDMYRIATLKILNDGTIESQSCAMYQPYPNGKMVDPMVSGQKMYDKCVEAASKGFDIHVHAIGNKSIHETLMMAKAVREAGYFDTRITNAHTHITLHDDLPLFGKYNVIANTSSIWHYYTPEALPLIGEERAAHQFELGSILRHGARMTLSSDFPVDEMGPEPLKGIQMGVTRQLYSDPNAAILGPVEERLSVEQCLEAYTINAAYCMHMEDRLGSIEVGKYADLVILEKDITAMDPHEIMDTPILLTMLNGKATYQNEKYSF